MKVEIKHDFQLDIATAHSRLAKKWKNKKWSWADLVKRCSETKRTGESVKEYAKMSREEQSDIKDVGGFVGGYLSGGTRKTPNVMWRSLITLDIDYGTPDFWDDFTLAFNFAAVLYSTHKHTPETPRYRLIIPLNRDVKPGEYEPICRKIADAVGIDLFDVTTYQLPRLFYWPSTSRDGEYIFEFQDGPACNADEILATYRNWHDVSEWPVASREGEAVAHEIRKAGDPLEKPGLIGAFCRAYTIEEAIEKFLPDAYERTATDGRYTYKAGSVAGGLVCYEGKFAYSHHETDPASRQLCNAFDLVRIHLYGIHDEGTEIKDVTKRPSYLKMADFVGKDKNVRVLIAKEKRAEAEADFAGVDLTGSGESEEDQNKWLSELEYDRKGNISNTNKSRTTIARNDENLRAIRYDLFKGEFAVTDPDSKFKSLSGTGLDNIAAAKIAGYIEDVYGLKINYKELVAKLLYPLADERGFNPVRDFITAEEWDGKARVDTLLIDYLGADDTELTRAVTRKWLTAAVARVFNPGCKFDGVLTLQGPQGIGKSLILTIIAGSWYNGNFSFSANIKEQREILADSWIVENGELAGMKKADVESAKAFISNVEDKYRRPYGALVEHFPRHCVMAATTNEDYFLRSTTGDRRWWIVAVKGTGEVAAWLPDLKKNVAQIWAEAYAYYRQGETLYLSPELEKEARKMQEAYNVAAGDPLLAPLQEWLDTPLPPEWNVWPIGRRLAFYRNRDPLEEYGTLKRDRVCVAEIKAEFPHPEIKKYTPQQISKLMEHCDGWIKSEKTIRIPQYGKPRGWIRDAQNEPPDDDI